MTPAGVLCLIGLLFIGLASPAMLALAAETMTAAKTEAQTAAETGAAPESCADRGPAPQGASGKIAYWQASQRRGANYFDFEPNPEKFASGRSFGMDFARLAFDKWPTAESHFLMGDLWYYDTLVEADLEVLRNTLDAAAAANMAVVLTSLRLPGLPYRHADGDLKGLLWSSEDYRDQAIRYWRDIAAAVKDHPAIVAYNLINEPNPEDPRLVDDFYKRLIEAIRTVDPDTPIMLDAPNVAAPAALAQLPRFDDDGVLYAFHLFEPVPFTFPRDVLAPRYPGWLVDAGWQGYWDIERLGEVLEPVRRWQVEQEIAQWRIVAGEFGGSRFAPGLDRWLADVIELLNRECWHWAYYAYREDGWDGMDYELGDRNIALPPLDDPKRAVVLGNARTSETPAFRVLRRAFLKR